MKITSVTTAVVEANFDYVFVRVTTDEGLAGTGECFSAPGITQMIHDFGQVIVGCSGVNRNDALSRLFALASGFGGAGAGMAYNAISGIDAALWDLAGRATNQSIAAQLGGAVVDEIPVYVDLHTGEGLESVDRTMRYRTPFWMSGSGRTEAGAFYFEAFESAGLELQAMLARAERALGEGFTRFKFDLDVFRDKRRPGDRSVSREDVRSIGETALGLRQRLGELVEIAFDCHWRFDVPSAIAITSAIEPMRPMWLEDPTPATPSSLATVAAQTAVPIATGENTYLIEGFEQLIQAGGVAVLQPDVQKTGGLTEAAKILTLADRHFLPVAPHCIASPLGFLATAQVCATMHNVMCLEFHGADVAFWNELVISDRPIIENGAVRIPSGPGVGVELNEEVARRFASRDELFFGAPLN